MNRIPLTYIDGETLINTILPPIRFVVGERAEKYSHSAPQEVMIYYRDIGLLDTTEEQDLQNELAGDGPAA